MEDSPGPCAPPNGEPSGDEAPGGSNGLAEELSQLLATIHLDAAVLEGGDSDAKEVRLLAGEILRASERLADLCRSSLQATGAGEQGEETTPRSMAPAEAEEPGLPQDAPPAPPEVVGDLNRLVAHATKTFADLWGRELTVTLSLSREILPVLGSETRVRQAFYPLVMAARESMEPGGALHVETARVERRTRGGLGMGGPGSGEHASLRLVFPACARLPALPTPPRVPGGRPCTTPFIRSLADAQRLVSEAGGLLQVAVTPGAPSWLTVLLPLAELREGRAERALRQSWPLTPGATVLVVDGDPVERSRAAQILRSAAYRVIEAESAEAAELLVGAGEAAPKLLLTDLMLPGQSGNALAERLGRRFPRMQVLYTASVARRVIEASGDLSPDASFTPKPLKETDLLIAVRRLMDIPSG